MNYREKIITDIELHSVEGIRECFENGIDPNDLYNGLPLIEELISEYGRGPSFKKCMRLFVDYGLEFEDEALLCVLTDDAEKLNELISSNSEIPFKKISVRSAYTPLFEVTLLHVCAEFNHTACANVLLENGADINSKAGSDDFGFGGQTPIFHTVNQNRNQSSDMLDLLLNKDAALDIQLKGLIWGKSYPWETLIPSIDPISYCMMGLLPQMHRDPQTIASVIKKLLEKKYGGEYIIPNIPNQYLIN